MSTRSKPRAARKNGKTASRANPPRTDARSKSESTKPEPKNPVAENSVAENSVVENPVAESSKDLPPVDIIGYRAYGRVPLWLLVMFSAIGALYFARAILFPVVLAFVLYFLFAPAVRLLTRFHWMPEAVAAAIVVLGASAGIGAATYVLAGPVSEWIANVPATLHEAEHKLQALVKPVSTIDAATEKVSNLTSGTTKEGVIRVALDQPPVTSYLLSASMNFVAGLVITVALVFLLLAMGHRTLNSIVELMPTREDKRGVVAMIRNVEQGISSYLLTVTAINIGLGIVIGTALGLLGFPDPILLGIMACTLNFIPYLGCIMGTFVTFLIGIVDPELSGRAVIGALTYLTINALEGNVITTILLGRSMKLNPPIVFISIVFWGWVWGVGGILIAIPLLGIAKIACDHFPRLQPIARILAG